MTNSCATEVQYASDHIRIAYRHTTINGDTYLENIMVSLEKQSKQLLAAIQRDRAKSALKKKNVPSRCLVLPIFPLLLAWRHRLIMLENLIC